MNTFEYIDYCAPSYTLLMKSWL